MPNREAVIEARRKIIQAKKELEAALSVPDDQWPKRMTMYVHDDEWPADGGREDLFLRRVCGFKDKVRDSAYNRAATPAYEIALVFDIDKDGRTALVGAWSGTQGIGEPTNEDEMRELVADFGEMDDDD